MNVLLVLYHTFECNSANHVDGIARVLCERGCDCIVATPGDKTRAELMGHVPYKSGTYREVLARKVWFDSGGPIEVVHNWTPREVIRRFNEELRAQGSFASIVHMEDNEELIARSQLRGAYDEFADGTRSNSYPPHLSHPIHWKQFLEQADGITIIIDSLREIIPKDKPVELAWPSTDERAFFPRPIDPTLRAELGIKPGETVLAYHGNVHHANFREVRSLYLAVALLNREGFPTRLLRTGKDFVGVDPTYQQWCNEHAINVGFVPSRGRLAAILSQADIFVQPGLCDAFNEYRFPSKVPDFLALGRPVILPRTNIGLVTKHEEDAYVLDEATGPAIADAIKIILADGELKERLASGSRKFFETHLRWPDTARKILSLYERVLNEKMVRT